jgi:hypothetical protein
MVQLAGTERWRPDSKQVQHDNAAETANTGGKNRREAI